MKCFVDFPELRPSFIQPERSKREDLDCCIRLEQLENLKATFHNEFCHSEHYEGCNLIDVLINESKMRCSEHCGNTVRGK